jgi:hypothetical protein
VDDNDNIISHPLKNFGNNGRPVRINLGDKKIDKIRDIPGNVSDNFFAKNSVGEQENIKNISDNFFEIYQIDSLDIIEAPNSIAYSYLLCNNWKLISVFRDGLMPYSFSPVYNSIILLYIAITVLFLMILVFIINRTLLPLNMLTKAMRNFDQNDLYD